MSIRDLYKAAEASWLVKEIDKKHLKHYINLLPVKEDMRLAHGMPKDCVAAGFAEMKKSFVALQDVPLQEVESSFAALELWMSGNRGSFISSTSSSSANSIFSQSSKASSLASLITQYSDNSQAGKTIGFPCPTCDQSCTRSNDLLKHLRKCEKSGVKRYMCLYCQLETTSPVDMDAHRIMASRLDPQHCLGAQEFEVTKVGLGCPHCKQFFRTIDYRTYDECLTRYHHHIVQHAKSRDIVGRGSPSKRVLASIREDLEIRTTDGPRSVRHVVKAECRRQGLSSSAWETFQWEDANAAWLWDRLEHGQLEQSDSLGETDVDSFFCHLVRTRQRSDYEDHILRSALASSLPPPPHKLEANQEAIDGPRYGSTSLGDDSGLASPAPPHPPHHKRKRNLSDTSWRSQQLSPGQADLNKPLPPPPSSHEQLVPIVEQDWNLFLDADGVPWTGHFDCNTWAFAPTAPDS
ncbi:hypothetical protein LTR27_003964 [Elasticomyces elasticus]|nr:hypothetical protein LTR27_003964 [Elasticomyces elasticus]